MGPVFLGAVKALLLAQAVQGTVVGKVWDAETADPIEGAAVMVADLDRAAATDELGRYVLHGVPAGSHPIVVRIIGYEQRSIQALVPATGRLQIDFWLLPEPVRIRTLDVHAPLVVRGLDTRGTNVFPDREISSAAMKNHPMLAEPDALQALGGGEIFLRPESPSGVNIRGGSSDQTAYLLDGIPVLNPYHAAGVSSGWNPDAISRVRVASPASLDAAPHALAGAIEGTTRAPGGRLRGQGSVSTTQSRITIDGPLDRPGAGFLVGLRSGLPDAFAPRDETSYLRGETGDWLAKVVTPALGGRFQILGYGNENELDAAVTVAPENGSAPDPRRNRFEWISRSLGAQWSRTFSSTTVRVVGFSADGDAGSLWSAPLGRVDMAEACRLEGFHVSAKHDAGLATTTAEARLERIRTSYRIVSDSTSIPEWTLGASAPVATAVARHGRALGRNLEIDLSSALVATTGRQYLEPSASMMWNPSDRLAISGRYARTHQFAQSLRNAESVVGNVFPVDLYVSAAAPGIPVGRSHLGVIAASYRPRAGLRLGVQAYERRSDGLLLVAPREGAPFATTSDAFVVGSGTSRGVSAEVSLSATRYGIVATYGHERSRVEHGDGSYLPESGATHLFEGGVIAFPSATTSIRLGLTAAIGRRATGIAGGFEWEATNLLDRGSEFGGSPDTGGEPLGGAALPTYYRLDLGVRKEWRIGVAGREGTIALFGTATNVLGRKNVLTYARDPDALGPAAVEMRPRAPLVVGLDWGF